MKKLSDKTLRDCFRAATEGSRVDMTVREVGSLLDTITARTKAEAIREIREALGWEN